MSESLSFNLTQLKDLEYICELAQLYLKGTGGQWPERIERYRGQLLNRIEELEAEPKFEAASPAVPVYFDPTAELRSAINAASNVIQEE